MRVLAHRFAKGDLTGMMNERTSPVVVVLRFVQIDCSISQRVDGGNILKHFKNDKLMCKFGQYDQLDRLFSRDPCK